MQYKGATPVGTNVHPGGPMKFLKGTAARTKK